MAPRPAGKIYIHNYKVTIIIMLINKLVSVHVHVRLQIQTDDYIAVTMDTIIRHLAKFNCETLKMKYM